MYKAEIQDYYHTGKYALEYMTCEQDDELACLEVGETRIRLVVRGKAKIIYKDRVFYEEHELTDEVRKLIGKESKKLEIRRSPEYVFLFEGRDGRNDCNPLGMDFLPSNLSMESFMDELMRVWVKQLNHEGLTGEEEMNFLQSAPRESIQMELYSNVRNTTGYNMLEEFLMKTEDILMYTNDLHVVSEKDNHGNKWLSVGYASRFPHVRELIQKELVPLGNQVS